VYDNVAYALQVTGRSRKEIRGKVPDILRLTGLSTKLHNYPDQLSGGEQQRVSIARAFVNHPPLLLADEPTGNLDSRTSIEIMGIFQELNDHGITVVMVTHEPDIASFACRNVIMRDGLVRSDRAVTQRSIASEELAAPSPADDRAAPEP
jgi:cell division transport system ATP-binding protein